MDDDRLKKNRNKNVNNAKKSDFEDDADSKSVTKERLIDDSSLQCRADSVDDFEENFIFNIEFDVITIALFTLAAVTRFYKISHPNHVVFDELHYGKFVGHYLKNTFFFDFHPPLGKQLIAAVSYITGYRGNYTFTHIGKEYSEDVPILSLRFVPALCGSLLAPCVYKLLRQLKSGRNFATLGGLLITFDNALITQSRFILMEPILLLFTTLGLLYLLKFNDCLVSPPLVRTTKGQYQNDFKKVTTLLTSMSYACLAATFLTFAFCTKFSGIYSGCLACAIVFKQFWNSLKDKSTSDLMLLGHTLSRSVIFVLLPIAIYLGIFWIHLNVLYKAGPHDMVMTSAFQASLDGGLASITKGQPLVVAQGSQITLRHTFGRTCWLHSHAHVYPVRYPDKRGSSHQQQVTCYSFKDVNNWWIVKRPDKNDLVVDAVDAIRHGDEIELIHGITSRALNSHDVAAAMTPQCQEVTCYIDYNISMPAYTTWKVDILNREQEGQVWHTIKSRVRLLHKATGFALRVSGRQLPEWGFNQHEVVTDRIVEQDDTIWNVEEHRYTKTEDQRERERQLINTEMIPTTRTSLTFFEKVFELQQKIFWHNQNNEATKNHMYASNPLDWPLMDRGIAYWIDRTSNAQIHLIGNISIWYSGTAALFIYFGLLVFYALRRRRLCYDIPEELWNNFVASGSVCFFGYLFNYVPYFLVDRALFLHNYLPALMFKIMLLCIVLEHISIIISRSRIRLLTILFRALLGIWFASIIYVFIKFTTLSYGHLMGNNGAITADDILQLQWKNTWDFILHADL